MRYGHAGHTWGAAKAEGKALLAEVARSRGTVTYGEFCRGIAAVSLTPRSPALIDLLGDICAEEDAARGTMLASLVVRASDGIPGRGYFVHAERLGQDVSDREAFWRSEVEKVYSAWNGSGDKP